MQERRKAIEAALESGVETSTRVLAECLDDVFVAFELFGRVVANRGKILWCGNGGSAAQAQHLSTELITAFGDSRRSPVPSISLTTDSSLLTGWTNDNDFESVFARQVEALGAEGDLLVCLSTSGASPNVVAAARQALGMGMMVVALTGSQQAPLHEHATVSVRVPSDETQRVQEAHILVGHILCEIASADVD